MHEETFARRVFFTPGVYFIRESTLHKNQKNNIKKN